MRERLEPLGRACEVSAPRRSPEPRVVRYAAFVSPIAEFEQVVLLGRVEQPRREPASASSRQKSLRGFAKCAPAAAERAAGVDPAEDEPEAGREHVRDGGTRRAR